MLLRKGQHLELKVKKNWGGDYVIFLTAFTTQSLIALSQIIFFHMPLMLELCDY